MNNNNYLKHYGILGMKWGVRRYQNPDGSLTSIGRNRYSATSSDSNVTKRVKKDLASLSGAEFRKKYGTSSKTYMKRVDRYGDPYMNAPLAKIGKFLEKEAKSNSERIMKKAIKAEEKKKLDIDNLKSNKEKMLELKSKSGKPLFVEKDIDEMISSLEANKLKVTKKLSGPEKKQIRSKKNKILNETIDLENKVSEGIKPKNRDDISEVIKLSNEYLKNNPDILPKGIKMRYDEDSVDRDDGSIHSIVTYNGKVVNFQFGNHKPSDRFLLEEPVDKKIKHEDVSLYDVGSTFTARFVEKNGKTMIKNDSGRRKT